MSHRKIITQYYPVKTSSNAASTRCRGSFVPLVCVEYAESVSAQGDKSIICVDSRSQQRAHEWQGVNQDYHYHY